MVRLLECAGSTYGMRGKAEEPISTLKRLFGEGVRAMSRERMSRELRMKVNCYNVSTALAARGR